MQVARIAKIPGPRVYDVLRKLESMGFVVKEPRKREPKCSAVPVKAALERYSKELAASYRDKEKLVKEVSAKLEKTSTPAIPTEEVAYALDPDQIANWAIKAVVKKKVWGIGKLDKPIFKAYPDILKLLSDLRKEGVKCKFLIDAAKYDSHLLKKVAKYAEVRHWGGAPNIALYIIDGKEILVAIPTPKTAMFYGFLIKHHDLVKLTEDYFISKFKEGIPLEKKIKALSKS
jgi:sugar-specific transcriptional regulator TrmB